MNGIHNTIRVRESDIMTLSLSNRRFDLNQGLPQYNLTIKKSVLVDENSKFCTTLKHSVGTCHTKTQNNVIGIKISLIKTRSMMSIARKTKLQNKINHTR